MSPPSSLQPPTESSAPIELERVQKLFADPRRISESQFLRREIAQRMHERLALVKIAPQCVIDAGCGEGADLSVLQNRFPAARILGIDASPAMLSEARNRHNGARSSMHRALSKWLAPMFKGGHNPSPMLAASNFAQLPLAANTTDLVWSNLALHWHPQPDYVFAEWRRVLRVDGLLMFSCFGPDTFKELRTACMHMDTAPHTLPFVDMHDFGDMLVNAGFSTPVMDMEAITVTYGTVEKLLNDVRAWGGNPLASRRRGLVGTGVWRRMVQALEAQRLPNGSISLSFEIIYGHAFRPAPRTTAAGEAIVRLDLHKK